MFYCIIILLYVRTQAVKLGVKASIIVHARRAQAKPRDNVDQWRSFFDNSCGTVPGPRDYIQPWILETMIQHRPVATLSER